VSILLAALVFGLMLGEAALARRNERRLLARGGVEPVGDVYRFMQIVYPASFLAMIVEGIMRGAPSGTLLAAGSALFCTAKALKYWAIGSLGPAWTFRVIVVPGGPLVSSGPYRYVRHPNYLAVVGELVGVALMTGAYVTGPVATALFGALMLKRMIVEDRALGRRPYT
jgi:methyltransferase